jgi:hypothetical protein
MLDSPRVADQLRQHLRPESVAASVTTPRDDTIAIANPSGDSDRLIEVRIRDDSDVEVALFVPGRPGSPFEQVFSGPVSEADLVLREALTFVGDLVADRVVLAWDSRPLRGGRRFLKASDLNPETLRHLAWVVSWRGTHDRQAPAV